MCGQKPTRHVTISVPREFVRFASVHCPGAFYLLLSTFSSFLLSTSIPLDQTMNWTGGSLRRHSNNNKSASISKIQKQNFAKSKTRPTKNTSIQQQLPFCTFSQFRQVPRDDGDAPGSTQQVRACRNGLISFTDSGTSPMP